MLLTPVCIVLFVIGLVMVVKHLDFDSAPSTILFLLGGATMMLSLINVLYDMPVQKILN